jgi:hypothetical protein
MRNENVRKVLTVEIFLLLIGTGAMTCIGNCTLLDGIVIKNTDFFGDSPPSELWNKTYSHESIDYAAGKCIRVISDGGYIVIGYSGGANHYSFYLLKVDEQGNEVWNQVFGCGYIEGNWVEVTNDNGFIITGRTGSYQEKVWLIKTDGNGILEWSRTYSGSGDKWGTCVKQTSDGHYVLAGYSSNGDFLMKTDASGNELWTKTYKNCSFGSFELTTDGGYICVGEKEYSMFLMKTDPNGTIEWEKTYFPVPSPGASVGNSVQQTSDGGYITTGMITNFGGTLLLLKTDENGNQEWNDTFLGGGGYSVIQMTNSDYVVGGFILPHQLVTHFWVIRTHSDGNVVWNGTYMPSRCALLYSLRETPDHGIIATGITDPFDGSSKCVILRLAGENQPPVSSPIKGRHWGFLHRQYRFEINLTDPDGGVLFCQWDWGDGNMTSWLGPYASNETVSAAHSWSHPGKYEIRVYIKDYIGSENSSPPHVFFYKPVAYFLWGK